MPFGKDIEKQIEKALFNYSKLDTEDIRRKHINLALSYFDKRPHRRVIKEEC